MPDQVFTKSFTQQEPICEEGIERAVSLLRSARLHRYNLGEDEKCDTALFEEEFASYIGMKYCLACASCGSALYLALKSLGVGGNDKVLCNAYTLAPVPSAIENCGAEIVLVEITDQYSIDLTDLENKAADARWLVLSHMRGHIANMDRIMEVCKTYDLTLIEDCAHTLGAEWNGKKSGSFGKVACFSTQGYKHLNSGEGGILVTDDPDLMARAIVHSGSYMFYDHHTARPSIDVFDKLNNIVPNYSCRMDNLRAAILRPQLARLNHQVARWNKRYLILEKGLNSIDGITCPQRDARELYVGSSIQFSLSCKDEKAIKLFLQGCMERGVELKWFGSKEPVGFTSVYSSWEYFIDLPTLPNTDRILHATCDMRIPLTFSEEDCEKIINIIKRVAEAVLLR